MITHVKIENSSHRIAVDCYYIRMGNEQADLSILNNMYQNTQVKLKKF